MTCQIFFSEKISHRIRTIIFPLIAMLFLTTGAISFADMKGINLILKNDCKSSINFLIHSQFSSQFALVGPNRNSKPIFLKCADKNNISYLKGDNGGHLDVSCESKAFDNRFVVDKIHGNIFPDKTQRTWHDWSGTASLTVTACPEKIDVKHSPILHGITRVLVFGDSLSDAGLIHKLSFGRFPRNPPYYNGSFSNGEIWAELLEEQLSGSLKFSNYAVAASPAIAHIGPYLPYTLHDQVDAFKVNSRHWKDKGHYMAIIFIGANDYLTPPFGKMDVGKKTDGVVNGIHKDISKLMKLGVKKFVLIGLPSLSLVPEAPKLFKHLNTGQQLSIAHNNKLQALAKAMQKKNKKYDFIYVPLYDTFNDIVFHTKKFNKKYHLELADVKTMCWKGGYLKEESSKLQPCKNPVNHLFWDEAHPTTQVHNAILEHIKSLLKIKTVPRFR